MNSIFHELAKNALSLNRVLAIGACQTFEAVCEMFVDAYWESAICSRSKGTIFSWVQPRPAIVWK